MKVVEIIKLAIGSIKDNFLRSLLTLLIIAVGITCMVGILTAIDSVLNSTSKNFSTLGANSFTIYNTRSSARRNRGKVKKQNPVITYGQALNFKDRYSYTGAKVSVQTYAFTSNAVIKYKNEATDPNISVRGIDEDYLDVTAYEIDEGRNFSPREAEEGGNKVILGSTICEKLFGKKVASAIGKIISVDGRRFKVIGVLKKKGSSAGASSDNRVFLPLFEGKKIYGSAYTNYALNIALADPTLMENAISSSIGVMRSVRKLRVVDKNNFEIRKSDSMLKRLKSMTKQLRIGTMIIVALTLLGAAIGLMNIMLVTVTERTREIGVRKSLGATRRDVLYQFLIEAVIICLLGGVVGVLFGMGIGFVIAKVVLKSTFAMPWFWMILSFVVCIVVGVVSGLYPALKASKLDPIESLRYE